MTPSDETLMAYVDGELDAQARVEVEAAMLANPDIAARVARQQALRKRVRLAFERVVEEPVPDRLLAAAAAAATPLRTGNVVPLRRKQPPKWSWREWSSMAACLATGVVLTLLVGRYSNIEPIKSRAGSLLASGALAQALSEQLASNQAAATAVPVHIGVSFRDKNGNFCRTFALRDSSPLAGLACRSGDRWRLEVLARAADDPDSRAANYRPAASSLSQPILQAVQDRIAGEPLDARAEAAAKDSGWQAAAH